MDTGMNTGMNTRTFPQLLGRTLRAARVVAGAAFEVVLLGRADREALGQTPSFSSPGASASPASMMR
jgi:hypothetical protein